MVADAPTFEVDGVLYMNTTVIHATAAFNYAVSSNAGPTNSFKLTPLRGAA